MNIEKIEETLADVIFAIENEEEAQAQGANFNHNNRIYNYDSFEEEYEPFYLESSDESGYKSETEDLE